MSAEPTALPAELLEAWLAAQALQGAAALHHLRQRR